jgi:NAD(P)-dependent dehydrogenase (short-subunit alcohol dehydrogenase family)
MNIIITGGSRGIGRDAALSLSEDKDNKILITGRNETALREVAAAAINENISWFRVDFSKKGDDIKYLTDHIFSLFSIVDILVNNAGFLVNRKFAELSTDDHRHMMEVNYFAPATLIRSLLPLMKKGSHIVNISSMGGFQGSAKFAGLSGYSASKAAIACLTECIANELSDSGISVNCLAFGSVQTEMLEEAFPGYDAPVSSAEMGKFVGYFAANGNKFFNGKILPVAFSTP